MQLWRFRPIEEAVRPYAGDYSLPLVLLSVVIAALAAYCSLAVVERMAVATSPRLRRTWHVVGAVAMGSGIWAMHFTGMLAFRLPVSFACGGTMTALSVIPAVVGAAAALRVMAVADPGWRRSQAAALTLALGIGAMHYSGMEAMHTTADMRYRAGWFLASIVVAHLLATVALTVRFAVSRDQRWSEPFAACVMGTAVAGMHYTAMKAAVFYPTARCLVEGAIEEPGLSPGLLALMICTVVVTILGMTFVGTIVDSRLSSIAAALDEESAQHRAVVESMVEGLVVLDPDGTMRTFNPAACRMFGYMEGEVVGRHVSMLVAEGSRDRVDSLFRRGHEARQLEARHKDGSCLTIEVNASEVRVGSRLLFSATLRDLSESRMMEMQLRQAQKLESIGQLASGIAHEINTPTQYVGDNIRFLKDSFADVVPVLQRLDAMVDEAREAGQPVVDATMLESELGKADVEFLFDEVPRAIDQSLDGIGRIGEIVRAMKTFSHPGEVEKRPFDINRAIENTVIVARNEWKYVADVETDFDPSLDAVPGLPGDFNQVILNLIVNSAQAIAELAGDSPEKKGTIRIVTKQDNGWAVVRVEDTGGGIPENIRSRVFDPFFTTKAVGKGTGQGLSIAHSVVVKKHGGSLEVDSTEGVGTTFVIRLPLQATAAAAS